MEIVPSIFGDHVGIDAAAGHIGSRVTGLISGLLEHGVIDISLDLPVVLGGVDEKAVQQVHVVMRRISVRCHVSLLDLHGSAYIRRIQVNAGYERAERLHVAGAGKRVHIGAGENLGVGCIFDIHRCDSGIDIHCFGCSAHSHGCIDCDGNVCGHVGILLHRAEARNAESHCVHAGTYVDNCVTAL